MRKNFINTLFLLLLLSSGSVISSPLKALIITGQNNHNWKVTSVVFEQILEQTGLFEADRIISPEAEEGVENWFPEFIGYDVVVLDYNGQMWNKITREDFEDYVRSGGGVVLVHAADNAFGEWDEYTRIIGLGGWGGRDEQTGPYVYWEDDKIIRDMSPGNAGMHGEQHAFQVVNRSTDHPITAGLPEKWMHARDELYGNLRGPGENMTILSTALSDTLRGGTGKHEPVLFTIEYGAGRIFHTVLGHVTGGFPHHSIECAGFITTFQRGTEWAATGAVTQSVPNDFPGPRTVRRWHGYKPPTFTEQLHRFASYQYGDNREILTEIEEMVRVSYRSPVYRKDLERSLAEFLSFKATFAAKEFALRRLSIVGTEMSAPVLTSLLMDDTLSAHAMYALERIPGQIVTKALRSMLPRTTDTIKISIVHALGNRRDAMSVPTLGRLLRHHDSNIVAASATSLGKIGGKKAERLLKKGLNKTEGDLHLDIADAYLQCADNLRSIGELHRAAKLYKDILDSDEPVSLRSVALRGAVLASEHETDKIILKYITDSNPKLAETAITLVKDIENLETVRTIADYLPKLPIYGQVQLLSVLSNFKDKNVNEAVFSSVKSGHVVVRVTAMQTLGKTGDASAVSLLATIAAEKHGQEKIAARESLYSLVCDGVNETIINGIRETEPEIKTELIRAAHKRRIYSAVPKLLSVANDEDRKVRIASIKALRDIATVSDITALIQLLLVAKSEQDRIELEKTIYAVAVKKPEDKGSELLSALPDVGNVEIRASMCFILGKLGDRNALPILVKMLNSENLFQRLSAVRALSEWPDSEPLQKLMALTKSETNIKIRGLALRGAIRLIGLSDARSQNETTTLYEQAIALATDISQKKAVLSGLSEVFTLETLTIVHQYLSNVELRIEAQIASVKIMENIHNQHPDECKPILLGIIQDPANDQLKEDAQNTLNQVEKFSDYITKWMMSEPYTVAEDESVFGKDFPPEYSDIFYPGWTVVPENLDPNRYWYVDFVAAIKSMVAAIYMRTYVWSEIEQAVRLEMGSNDGIKTWLNGEIVHVNDASRAVTAGEDVIEVTLNQGWNSLLMKIVNEGGGWGGCARFRRLDGGHLSNIRAEVKPTN
ncbi:MAG: HEAT repeat domain-containing protein [Candidatus Marinimicrobia bacterium]|nr:HEAT repeat domain-containing protein [Candidatus Neomarinimicrobiota bacterium]